MRYTYKSLLSSSCSQINTVYFKKYTKALNSKADVLNPNLPDNHTQKAFVTIDGDNIHAISVKPGNVLSHELKTHFYSLLKILGSIDDFIESDRTFSDAAKSATIISQEIYKELKIELNELECRIMLILHKNNHYSALNALSEDKLFELLKAENIEISKGSFYSSINSLKNKRCIDIIDGKIFLIEKITVTNKNSNKFRRKT